MTVPIESASRVGLQCVCVVGANSSGKGIVTELLPHVSASVLVVTTNEYSLHFILLFTQLLLSRHPASSTSDRTAISPPPLAQNHANTICKPMPTLKKHLPVPLWNGL